MNETTSSELKKQTGRFAAVHKRLQGAAPFTGGIVAAFIALLLYNTLFPAPAPITAREVQDTVAQTMASATPPPSASSLVYQVIQPSLVLIQSKGPGPGGS